jgi:hypothetical protein
VRLSMEMPEIPAGKFPAQLGLHRVRHRID